MVIQSIRERLTGILAFVILGILVIPFALVGVNEYFTSSGGNIVARINETEINTNDFNQSFSNYRRRMQSIMGAAYDPVEMDQLTVRREHLDDLIDRELLTQAAQSMGLDVDDETLAEEIRNISAFQVDGVFNTDVYQSRLMAQGLTPKQFQNEMRLEFIVNQLPRNIASSSIATSAEIEEFVALFEQERTFGAVMIPAVVEETLPEFSEEEITSWYESHSDDYLSEEQVIIEYVELDAAFMPAGPPPDEQMLLEQFEAQKARFISPEQRQVSHILIEVAPEAPEAEVETARQVAEDLSKRAMDGEDFATLASEASMKIAKEKGIEDPQKAAECLSCHVTAYGVDAALIGEKFDMANGVSCEACHGGGADYYKSATMKGLIKGEIEAASVGLIKPDEKLCVGCHNEKSPTYKEFDFEKMVAKIAHPIPDERKAKYKGE